MLLKAPPVADQAPLVNEGLLWRSDRSGSSTDSLLLCLLQSQASRPKAPDAGVSAGSSGSAAAAAVPDKPAHDVVAGAMARAASQSTIHPLDTMKVRMQAGSMPGELLTDASDSRWFWLTLLHAR
jgi:hypothetical protein